MSKLLRSFSTASLTILISFSWYIRYSLTSEHDEEVVVAPLLEALVVGGAVPVARVLQRAVEEPHVLLLQVVRREVRAAAEPPVAVLARLVLDLEVPGRSKYVEIILLKLGLIHNFAGNIIDLYLNKYSIQTCNWSELWEHADFLGE